MKFLFVLILLAIDSKSHNLDEVLNQCYYEGTYNHEELLIIWDSHIDNFQPSEKVAEFTDCFLKKLGVYGEDGVLNLAEFAKQIPYFLEKVFGNEIDVVDMAKEVCERCFELIPNDQSPVLRCFSVRNCGIKYIHATLSNSTST
uniref:Uncharacterized protein n=1 Tax=Photinus pyralis TaxID=7054 RepID=A0A1Y1NIE2_PHOPY